MELHFNYYPRNGRYAFSKPITKYFGKDLIEDLAYMTTIKAMACTYDSVNTPKATYNSLLHLASKLDAVTITMPFEPLYVVVLLSPYKLVAYTQDWTIQTTYPMSFLSVLDVVEITSTVAITSVYAEHGDVYFDYEEANGSKHYHMSKHKMLDLELMQGTRLTDRYYVLKQE